MSSRNRPRTHHNQDADEERRLWSQIKADGKRIDAMVVSSLYNAVTMRFNYIFCVPLLHLFAVLKCLYTCHCHPRLCLTH